MPLKSKERRARYTLLKKTSCKRESMGKVKKVPLWAQIFIGIAVGILIGVVSPKAAEVISPLGDIFLNLLKMLIVPLVFFSITNGICQMKDVKQLKSVGGRIVLYYTLSTVAAGIFGVIGGMITQPGRNVTDLALSAGEAAEASDFDMVENIVSWFPDNIVNAMAEANMLQIIIFCLFLGVALLALGEKVPRMLGLIEEGNNVMLKITEYVINLSPIGNYVVDGIYDFNVVWRNDERSISIHCHD